MKSFRHFSLAFIFGALSTVAMIAVAFPANAGKASVRHQEDASLLQSHTSSVSDVAGNIPILTYHYIHDYGKTESNAGKDLTVTPEAFERQIQWLSAHGYTSITMDDFLAIKNGQKTEPAKPVIITFDD